MRTIMAKARIEASSFVSTHHEGYRGWYDMSWLSITSATVEEDLPETLFSSKPLLRPVFTLGRFHLRHVQMSVVVRGGLFRQGSISGVELSTVYIGGALVWNGTDHRGPTDVVSLGLIKGLDVDVAVPAASLVAVGIFNHNRVPVDVEISCTGDDLASDVDVQAREALRLIEKIASLHAKLKALDPAALVEADRLLECDRRFQKLDIGRQGPG